MGVLACERIELVFSPMPWPRRTPAAVQLKRDNDALALQLVRLRE
jgi:hypothetical protein